MSLALPSCITTYPNPTIDVGRYTALDTDKQLDGGAAGVIFDKQSLLSSDDPVDAEPKCLTVSDPLVHWIDQMILSLHRFRTQLNEDSDDLVESFITAWEQRARWEADAIVTEAEGPRLPSSGESMASTLLGDRLARRLTNLGDADKRASWKYPRV